MSDRIVVSCRMAYGEAASSPSSGEGHEASRTGDGAALAGYLERARALTRHAEALGATLAAWSAVTVTFAWDAASLDEVVSFVTTLSVGGGADADTTKTPDGAAESAPQWAVGVAEGKMDPLAETEAGGGRADLAWGPPLVAAVALSRIAGPGDVLVDRSVAALAAGKLCTRGSRVSTDGTRRVRGARLDVRQPFRAEAAKSVARIAKPPLLGRPDPGVLLQRPGVVNLVRADPGLGGSRMLAEVAARVAPSPCLLVMPSGASVEPLGALRRALVRTLASSPAPKDDVLGPQLDMFLGGIGASIEVAAMLVESWLKTAPDGAPGALLIDDAGEVDAESLEACAELVASARVPVFVTVRVDATDALPSALFDLPRGIELDLSPLGRSDAEALARASTGNALTPAAARRWARRGTYAPLGILEAIQCGLTTSELAWIGDRAEARARVSGMGKGHGAAHWITRRAKKTAPNERGVLAAVALFGGEVSLDNAERALHAVDAPIHVREEAGKLVRAKWLVPTEPGWVALPTRTHRDTIAELLDEEPRRALHRAIAEVLEQSEGELGCAEAAHHAAKAGDGERGARLALRAARAAAAAGMTKSANRLLTLARLADPKCEPQTRRQLISSLPPPPAAITTTAGATAKSRGDEGLPVAARAPGSVPARLAPSPPRTLDVAPTELLTALTAEDAERILEPSLAAEDASPSEPRTRIDRPPAPAIPRPPTLASSSAGRLSPPPARGSESMRAAAESAPPRPPPLPRPTSMPPPLPRPPDPDPLHGSRPRIPAAPPVSAPPLPRSGAPRVAPPLPASASPPPPRPTPPPLPARARVDAEDRTIPHAPAPPRGDEGTPPSTSPASPPASPSAVPPTAPPPAPISSLLIAPAPGSSAALATTTGRTAWSLSDRDADAASDGSPLGVAASPRDEDLVAGRLTELSRMALVGGDASALERWSEGLRATGEHERFAERMEAMARLSRGQVGDALRVLKKAREQADAGSRAQASLALGVALAAAGRAEEALLEGLDALARAREKKDEKGSSACLAFLAKLFQTQQRNEDADVLRAAAVRA